MALFSVAFHYAQVTSHGSFNDYELADRLIEALQDKESYEIEIFNDNGESLWIPNNEFLLGFIAGLYNYSNNQLRVISARFNRIEIDNFRKGFFEARLMVN